MMKRAKALSVTRRPILWPRLSSVCIRRRNWPSDLPLPDGFYYDVDRETPFTAEDLEKIEAEMKKIVKENLEIRQFTMPRDEAIAYFKEKDEPYKVELIEDLPEDEDDQLLSAGRVCRSVRRPASDEHKGRGKGI